MKNNLLIQRSFMPIDRESAGTDLLTISGVRDINKITAYGKCVQSNLPPGYTEVEYLESSGTQYIDTGIKATQDDSVEVDYMYHIVSNITGSGRIFGSRYTSLPHNAFALGSSDGTVNTNTYIFCQFSDDTEYSEQNLDIGTWHKYYISQQGYFYDSQEIGTGFTQANFETPFTLKLFAFEQAKNSTSTSSVVSGIGRCKNFRIYRNNVLIQDLIPAKNSSNVVGMYDTVSGNFFTNAGTGDFIAGPDVVPSPSHPVDIVCNNGVLKARHQSELPLEYTKLEYLESSGAQYIDTGRVPNNTDIIEQAFQTKNTSSTSAVSWYGSMPSSSIIYPRISIGIYTVGFFCGINNTNNLGGLDTNKHTLKYYITGDQTGSYWFDGKETQYTTEISQLVPIVEMTSYLFARHGTNGVQTYDGLGTKIYYHREYLSDETLVLSLIPARRNSDNVVGMYDLVSGNFLVNQGTGSFIAGPEVSDPLEIYTDGTVETINVHGKNLFDKNASYALFSGYLKNASAGQNTFLNAYNGGDKTIIIKVTPNTTYTVTRATNLGSVYDRIRCAAFTTLPVDRSSGVILCNYMNATQANATFTTLSDTQYVAINVRNSGTVGDDWTQYVDAFQLELGSTATNYVPYFNGGTATTEMLLKVGDYADEQEIISGVVTRNIGVLVLDGTEDWAYFSVSRKVFTVLLFESSPWIGNSVAISSHFNCRFGIPAGPSYTTIEIILHNIFGRVYIDYPLYDGNLAGFKQWLADQYAAGTPVMIVYPLATPTQETSEPQHIDSQIGTNIIEVSQASLEDLDFSVRYRQK